MQKYDVHFCLVSGQAAPSLFPVSDLRFRPNKITLFVSDDMQKEAEQLEKIFKTLKIETKSYPISEPYDFEHCEEEIHAALLDYIGESQISDMSIALNLTGGTKPMSLAAYSVFSAYGKGNDAFYVDTSNHRFSFLTNKENSFNMQLELKVKNYLLAYGYKTLKSERTFNKKANELFFDFFIKNYHLNKNLISTLNYYADEASKNQVFYFNDKECNTSLYNLIYDIAEETRLVEIDSKKIDFKGNYKLFGGGWLECFVFQEVKKLNHIDDIEMSLEYANSAFDQKQKNSSETNSGRNNEFDVAFIAKNKLHIIECKAKRMDKGGAGEEDETQDIIHKIKSLKNNMGTMAKGCLVVCGKDKVPAAVRNRANDEDIKIIEGSQLQALGKHIQEWIDEE
ncbi:Card1-like endonuclease domain-containing protein [Mannheimia massilioguelmaensis]|uniref:Card1-like endonuclease domain-containing protein n=1 Tax=Mannheimia massilioguelmaensis TaxID=1604354 RepID=UPI0005CAB13F|nr:DUF1887 family CARF protein [Mannheimia massilioguelmaensis]